MRGSSICTDSKGLDDREIGRSLMFSSIYNMQAILLFFGMLKTSEYYYKNTFQPKLPDVALQIIQLLLWLTAIEKPISGNCR